MELSRRELIAAGAAAGAVIALDRPGASATAAAAGEVATRLDFSTQPDGLGWGEGWRTTGVANLRRADGHGLLEAGSDVFPTDPRPVAFAVDRRLRDAEISAGLSETGSAPGVVLRRRGPRCYFAAVYDTGRASLRRFTA